MTKPPDFELEAARWKAHAKARGTAARIIATAVGAAFVTWVILRALLPH